MFAGLFVYVSICFTCRLCSNVILGLEHMKYELLKENLHLLIFVIYKIYKHKTTHTHICIRDGK